MSDEPRTLKMTSTGIQFSYSGGNAILASGSSATGENYVVYKIANRDIDWVSVICETVDGEYHQELETERIDPGDNSIVQHQLPNSVLGRRMHIFRWAPGLLGIPGSGGGEAVFTMPAGGYVEISITTRPAANVTA